MPTAHFKLRFDDLTRRTSFPTLPIWQELSAKISSLYSIPQEQVGVTYIDAEGEEITLNTDDELQEYYQSSHRPEEPIKFTVCNLSLRHTRPSSSNIRNTFGQFVDLEDIPGLDEWQSINNIPIDKIFGPSSPTNRVRSAFVESVSEGSTITKGGPEDLLERHNGDAASQTSSQLRLPSADKGKARVESDLSRLSTQSVLAEDDTDKPPVHVYDVSSQNYSAAPAFSLDQTTAPIAAESTPRAQPQDLGDSTQPAQEAKIQELDDPPLPTFDSASESTPASASLARDVATFLNMFTTIISSHPELSSALRNIVQNTTSGTYWNVHREALSQAAAEFQRSTEALAEEGRRAVEEESGRRVAEALAGVLRIFSQTQPVAQPPPVPTDPSPINQTQTRDADRQTQTPPIPGGWPPAGFYPPLGRGFPFHHRHTWRGPPPNWTTGWWHRPPVFGSGALNATGLPFAPPMTPAAPGLNVPTAPGPASGTQPAQHYPDDSIGSRPDESLSPQELKAKVEEAKKAYKAEKERYRQQREERRREREMSLGKGDILHGTQTPDISISQKGTHIVSNARDGFPQFEMVNISGTVPQRHNTHLGHFPRRHEKTAADLFTRAVHRISRRLSDMGFTESGYPDLGEKIRVQLGGDGAVTKEREDDIVTTLLERLLAAPKTPVASGSGSKDIPGGWH